MRLVTLIGVSSASMILLSPIRCHAQPDVRGVKNLTWEMRARNIAGVRGTYRLLSRAYSAGTHKSGNGDTAWKRNYTPGGWPVAAGSPLVNSPVANDRESHAHAEADAKFSALPAEVISHQNERPPRYRISTTTEALGSEEITGEHVNGAWADAKHRAKADVTIRNARVREWTLRGEVNGVHVGTRMGKGRPTGRINEGGHSIHDPIALTLENLDTGALITEELFSIDLASWNAEGVPTSWMYDSDSGFEMSVEPGIDGSIIGGVELFGDASSGWLVEPYGEFGASLIDGIFTPHGAWADLPWDLTMHGFDVVGASIGAEHLPSDFSYVVPDDLLEAGALYAQSLAWDDVSEGHVHVDSVPSPGGALVLLTGGVIVVRRRDR